jgi:hypothetical protein
MAPGPRRSGQRREKDRTELKTERASRRGSHEQPRLNPPWLSQLPNSESTRYLHRHGVGQESKTQIATNLVETDRQAAAVGYHQ